MPIGKSQTDSGNENNGWQEKQLGKLPFPPKSHRMPAMMKQHFQTGVLSLRIVLSEKTHNKLPSHQPYDHTINLQPMFTPKIPKVYSLNPQKMETCEAFIKEHLETGHIIPSKSPQASPFFFIPKKNGTLHPCQDYCYLNSHTV